MDDGDAAGRKKEPLGSGFLKGFAAGIVVSHVNKALIVGLIVGTAAGLYVEQNFRDVPNVAQEIRRLWEKVKPRTGDWLVEGDMSKSHC